MSDSNRRLMTRNSIRISDVGNGKTMAILRHNKGAHTVTVVGSTDDVAGQICAELREIHIEGVHLTRREKADRVLARLRQL